MSDQYQNPSTYEEDNFKTPFPHHHYKKKKTHGEEDGKMTITVEEISKKPDRMAPIVAYFSSGYDQSSKSESPRVTVYRHNVEARKKLQLVVSPPDSSVEFVGTNYSGEGAARQTCVYSLGILDKETNTLKIVPIAHNKVFRLEPRVKTKEPVDAEAPGSPVVQVSQRDQFDLLNQAHGTKDAIKRDKKKNAMKVGDDPEAKEFIEAKLNKVNVKESALESTSAIVSRNIPPYNGSATTPEEAYPLLKIIDKGVWSFLQDVYRLENDAHTDAYPVFVRNRLDMVRDTKDETETQTLSVILSFITHLIKFSDMNSMNGLESAKDHKFLGIIRQKLTSLFKDPYMDKKMPDEKRALLTSYVLVLTLHVDNFKTDPLDITKDLRLNIANVRKHFEELGCKYSREKTGYRITLPLPIKFPQMSGLKVKRKEKPNYPSFVGTDVVDERFGYTFSPNVRSLVETLDSVVKDGSRTSEMKGKACLNYALSMFYVDSNGSGL